MNPEKSGKHYSFIPRPRGGIFFTTNRQIEPIGPSQQDIACSNPVIGDLNGQEGRITTPVAITLASIAGLGAGGVGGWFINDAFGAENPSETIPVGSFENSFNNHGPQIVPSERVKQPNKEEVFDNTATKGVVSENNTIRMTYEEYQKIAPLLIERENRKDIPVEVTAPTAPTGSRQLIIEQGTGINAVIFIKTPEGGIRKVHYIKKENPSQLIKHIGTNSKNVSFSSCSEYLGQKDEMQAGDIFPAPITGEVYYYGNRINYYKGKATEEGTVNAWYYHITGEYVDGEGKKFEAVASIFISSYSDLTKPLVEGMPNMKDYDSSRDDKEKMPRIKATQGDGLFQLVTKPSFKSFSSNSKEPKAQIKTTRGYFEKGGNRSGGEKCLNPSLDGKKIVPLQ